MDAEIPARVLEHFALSPAIPQTRLKQGVQCDTWVAGDLVIQHVSKQSYEHHLAVLERTAPLRLSGKLAGLVFLLDTIHDPDGSWWRAAPRLPGPSALVCGRDLLEVSEEIARQVGEELRTLATLPMGGLPAPAVNQDIRPEEIISLLEGRRRGGLARLMARIEPEPETPFVLAHGDPVLKNILLTEAGPVLIDWEFCQPLPAGYDIAHFVAVLVYNVDFPIDHERVLGVAREMAAGAGLELCDRELATLIAWGVAREVAVWGSRRLAASLPFVCKTYGLLRESVGYAPAAVRP